MKLLWAMLLSVSVVVAHAESESLKPTKQDYSYQHDVKFLVSLGIQNGGEPIHRLVLDGTNTTQDTLRAGGFWRGEAGVQLPIAQLPFSVDILGGIVYGETKSNINEGKTNFKRKALTVLPFFHFDRYRVGLGVTQHIDPTFTNSPNENLRVAIEYDDATGGVLQFDARYDANIMFGVRFTTIEYESDDTDLDWLEQLGDAETADYAHGLRKINGNSFGFHVTGSF